ncbi:FadR/GntR family transcriptional regulator [Nonomuraea angiospora]|uniref:DNA-binding FadR family transcriptional regulator n=1 Tax=Nonomuraea angiospora TaxID=46172 RepID=A0ABR9M5U9_9ACTN|nr:FCD domain-containing protein [Nonomuraea angiospora]MBE1588224.1 DNA-binding FadR family transcriptional regulator [Nonomuraea angiospora]
MLLDAAVLRWRFAKHIDETFLDELGEVRLTIEPAVARFAALRRTDRDLADLGDALAAMRIAADAEPERHVEADLAFYTALLRAARNRPLTRWLWRSRLACGRRQARRGPARDARPPPKAAEASMRTPIERSIEDVDTAKNVHPTEE